MVAMDLDGTLLTRDNGVSRFNAAMVRKATRAGIKIVLATGRTSATAERVGRRLGLPGPFICANGAHVLSIQPREDWQFTPISAEVLPGLLGILRRMEVKFEAAVRGGVVFERQNYRPKPFFQEIRARMRSHYRIIEEGTETLAGQVAKVFTAATAGLLEQVQAVGEAQFPGRLRYITTITSERTTLLEIQDASVNKGQALGLVAEKFGLAMNEVAAMGDGDNDVEMLEAAGMGVAMANASPKLAMVADRFALACSEDGVGHFLMELLQARR